jgi:hypothetical protein
MASHIGLLAPGLRCFVRCYAIGGESVSLSPVNGFGMHGQLAVED